MNAFFKRSLSKVVEKCPVDLTCRCNVLEELPAGKGIDFSRNLNGTTVNPWKHLLILSHGYKHQDDWPSKLESDQGSIVSRMSSSSRKFLHPYHPIMVSNVIVPGFSSDKTGPYSPTQRVLLYPDAVEIEFEIDQLKDFVASYLTPHGKREQVYNPFKLLSHISASDNAVEESFKEKPIAKDLVLICGHTKRDIRCGKIAPLLEKKFKEEFERRKLDVDVGIISHIGGHVYAGNVIYLPSKKGSASVWYGRVFPEHVAGIIDETIINGNIIKELYRGKL